MAGSIETRGEGIGITGIRIALLAFAVAAGHGRTAETEKDCSGDYAERFHWWISKLIGVLSPTNEVCRVAPETIKLQFRKLNWI
jgi:hypothetical protein